MTIWKKITGLSRTDYVFRVRHPSEKYDGISGVYIVLSIQDSQRHVLAVEPANDLEIIADGKLDKLAKSLGIPASGPLSVGVLLCPQSDAQQRLKIANDIRDGLNKKLAVQYAA